MMNSTNQYFKPTRIYNIFSEWIKYLTKERGYILSPILQSKFYFIECKLRMVLVERNDGAQGYSTIIYQSCPLDNKLIVFFLTQ